MDNVASFHQRTSLRLLLKSTHSNLVTSSQRVLISTQLVDREVTYNLFAIETSLSVILWFYLSQEGVMILKARPFQLAVGAEKDHVNQLVRRLHVLIYTACMYNIII